MTSDLPGEFNAAMCRETHYAPGKDSPFLMAIGNAHTLQSCHPSID